LSNEVSDRRHQAQGQQQQRSRDRRGIPGRVEAGAAVVIVSDDLIGQRAVRLVPLVAYDDGTGTPECSDEDITVTAGTAVCDAVHLVQAVAALTRRLDCTAG